MVASLPADEPNISEAPLARIVIGVNPIFINNPHSLLYKFCSRLPSARDSLNLVFLPSPPHTHNMSRCADCGVDLADSKTLCEKCFDASYAKLGHSIAQKSFRERLTWQNVLLFLGLFCYGFVRMRFPGEYLLSTCRYYSISTKTSLVLAFFGASFAFFIASSRRR